MSWFLFFWKCTSVGRFHLNAFWDIVVCFDRFTSQELCFFLVFFKHCWSLPGSKPTSVSQNVKPVVFPLVWHCLHCVTEPASNVHNELQNQNIWITFPTFYRHKHWNYLWALIAFHILAGCKYLLVSSCCHFLHDDR